MEFQDEGIIWKKRKLFIAYILIFLCLQIPLLNLKPPVEREGWLSDISYHYNNELTGNMAKDIPWGSDWSTGRGRGFYLIHHYFYKVFGIGLFQARLLTLIAGILLLFLIYKWSKKYLGFDKAILTTILLLSSFSFWPYLPIVSQDMLHFLFYFMSFYLLYSSIIQKKEFMYFLTGLVSALSIEVSFRGIEILICVYIANIIFTDRDKFLRFSLFLLLGSFLSFISWFCLNVLPMGINKFFQYHILVVRTAEVPNISKVLFSEIRRLILFSDTQRRLARIEILYWIILMWVFIKRKLWLDYLKVSKFIFYWLLITLVIVSFFSRIDYQSNPHYFLLYVIFVCIFCSISLNYSLLHKSKIAYFSIFLIMALGFICQIGRIAAYSYNQFFKTGYSMNGFNERLRAKIDINKPILGEVEYWFAFIDSQYYGGGLYLSRVKNALKELKSDKEYESKLQSAEAIMKVLKKRNIKYIVTSAGRDYLKYTLSRYFQNTALPKSNFKLIDSFSTFLNRQSNPLTDPFLNIEIYEITSYGL